MSKEIRHRINHQITASQLRVLDEEGNNLGLLSKEEALTLAVNKQLDLIEISPAANPPVARIMSFDKYRYQREKELKRQRSAQKSQEMKHVQVSVRAAKNDLERWAKAADEFLREGRKVEVVLRLRGREKYMKDVARAKMNEFLSMLSEEHKVLMEPKFGGRGMLVQIIKR